MPTDKYFKGTDVSEMTFPPEGLRSRVITMLQPHGLMTFSALVCAWPNIDANEPHFVHLWPSVESRAKGRAGRIKMKPGRAFRVIEPTLTDIEVSELVDAYKKTFYPAEYSFHQGTEAENFKHAYAHDIAEAQNVVTSRDVKLLNYSCMRYSFDDLPCHPCETYATGDFEMVWLETQGKIAARAVVCTTTQELGPIYTTSDAATERLRKEISARFELEERDGFIGARLKVVKYNEGYIAPYLDYEKSVRLSDCEKYFVISTRGDHDMDSTEGTIEVERGTPCYNCDCQVDEDESYSPDGETYCESCYSDMFFCSAHSGETFPRDEAVEVFCRTRNGTRNETWAECEVDHDAVYCEGVEEYWRIEDTICDVNGEHIPEHLASATHTYDDVSEEWYPKDEYNTLIAERETEDKEAAAA